MPDLNGLFLLDKPVGVRSTDCVSKFHAALRAAFKIKIRTGHAGTLDSTASGLLLLLAGRATRLSDYIMTLPKIYRATLRLGQTTDTCDYSGRIIRQSEPCDLEKISEINNRLDKILPSFYGWRMQRPPEISALKLNGRPSYKLARAGHEVKLEPRPVFLRYVKKISDVTLDPALAAPVAHVALEISCSKGTYVRSLARDIGDALGCGACIESLRRISIGNFHVDDALPLNVLATDTAASPSSPSPSPLPSPSPSSSTSTVPSTSPVALSDMLRSPREAAKNFHRVMLTPEAESRLTNGVATPLVGAGQFVTAAGTSSLSRDILCVEGENMIGFCDLIRPCASSASTASTASIDDVILLKPRANIAAGDK